MSEREKDLLVRAKAGDINAFEQLIEGVQKKVFNIIFKMVGNYEDASELSQEVFIKIYKSIKNFKEESTLSTWIYKIATNVCLDELRKRKGKHVISIDEEIKVGDSEIRREIVDGRPTPEAAAEKNEIRRAVSEAIKSLSDEHRIAIVLRDIKGLSYDEMSKILKCPEGTVKSRINRARAALREILKGKRELFSEEYVK
jgi:RNA polymerase sigma-70 factor, ECF subfamily